MTYLGCNVKHTWVCPWRPLTGSPPFPLPLRLHPDSGRLRGRVPRAGGKSGHSLQQLQIQTGFRLRGLGCESRKARAGGPRPLSCPGKGHRRACSHVCPGGGPSGDSCQELELQISAGQLLPRLLGQAVPPEPCSRSLIAPV